MWLSRYNEFETLSIGNAQILASQARQNLNLPKNTLLFANKIMKP